MSLQDFAVEVDPEALPALHATFASFAHVFSHISLVICQAKQLVLRMPEEASLQAQKVRKVLVERVDMRGKMH